MKIGTTIAAVYYNNVICPVSIPTRETEMGQLLILRRFAPIVASLYNVTLLYNVFILHGLCEHAYVIRIILFDNGSGIN